MNFPGACLLFLAQAALAVEPGPERLEPGVPAVIYAAPGRATTILFHGAEKIATISLASPVITYKYDRALNQLEITPAVRKGGVETNLNLRIGTKIYVLIVRVVEDARAQYLREFVPGGEAEEDDEAGLEQARPLAPAEIELPGAARVLEQADADPVFRQAHPNLRIEEIRRDYVWEGRRIGLAELGQFLDQDLLLFRLRVEDDPGGDKEADPRRFGLSIAGRRIPITARYREGRTIYLAVQGYRLSRHNAWELTIDGDETLARSATKAATPNGGEKLALSATKTTTPAGGKNLEGSPPP